MKFDSFPSQSTAAITTCLSLLVDKQRFLSHIVCKRFAFISLLSCLRFILDVFASPLTLIKHCFIV